MVKTTTVQEYDIRIQDYEKFNETLEEIYLGLRVSQMHTMREIRSEIASNEIFISRLKKDQEHLLYDMQNSQLSDKED